MLSRLINALLAAFGALLPQLLVGLDVGDESLWRWSSIVLGTCVLASIVDSELRRHRLERAERANIAPLLYLALMGILVAIAVWQGVNATSPSSSPGPVFGGLVLLLANSAIVFVRFLVANRSGPSAA